MTPVDPLTGDLTALYAYPEIERAWVRTNFVASMDGASRDADGVSGGLGSAIDHQAFHVMRSLADVIVVGAGTARAEGYGPVQASEILPGASIPPIAVVTRSLDVPDRLVAPGQIVITSRSSDPQRRAELAATVDVIAAGDDDIDWHVVLDTLTERGLRKVLCEGGPNLHGTLIELDLVDEFCLTIAPVALAGGAPRIAHSHLASARSLELTHAVHDDGTILTRWTRKKD